MPIVFAAVVPHSPLLVPEVSKDHQRLLVATQQSYAILSEELHAAQPDVTIILTPHGPQVPQTFVAQIDDQLHGGLAEFGNVQIRLATTGAVAFGHLLKELAEDQAVPLLLQTSPELDYGTTVPLNRLSPANLGAVLPLTTADQDSALVIRLGNVLYEFCQSRPERVAILASADLSRRDRSQVASTEFSRPTRDERIIAEAISSVDPSQLLASAIQPTVCGHHPILALLTVLQPLNAHGTIRSFEAPFGVGLLVASLTIRH